MHGHGRMHALVCEPLHLYVIASGEPVLTRKELFTPGWSTSCPTAAMKSARLSRELRPRTWHPSPTTHASAREVRAQRAGEERAQRAGGRWAGGGRVARRPVRQARRRRHARGHACAAWPHAHAHGCMHTALAAPEHLARRADAASPQQVSAVRDLCGVVEVVVGIGLIACTHRLQEVGEARLWDLGAL